MSVIQSDSDSDFLEEDSEEGDQENEDVNFEDEDNEYDNDNDNDNGRMDDLSNDEDDDTELGNNWGLNDKNNKPNVTRFEEISAAMMDDFGLQSKNKNNKYEKEFNKTTPSQPKAAKSTNTSASVRRNKSKQSFKVRLRILDARPLINAKVIFL